jgi:hypothetical protein
LKFISIYSLSIKTSDSFTLYTIVARKLLRDALLSLSEIVESSYDVRLGQNYPLLGEIDAVVLTGSSKDVFCEFDYNNFRQGWYSQGHDSFSNGEENWILQLVDLFASCCINKQG